MEPTCQQAAVVIVLPRQPALVSPVTVLEELEKKVKVTKKKAASDTRRFMCDGLTVFLVKQIDRRACQPIWTFGPNRKSRKT
jgi:hypothetical protein